MRIVILALLLLLVGCVHQVPSEVQHRCIEEADAKYTVYNKESFQKNMAYIHECVQGKETWQFMEPVSSGGNSIMVFTAPLVR